MVVTSHGRNKNRDDETKKTKRRPIIAPAIAVRLLNKIFTFEGADGRTLRNMPNFYKE